MRQFYLQWPNSQTFPLSWSHYVRLLSVIDLNARQEPNGSFVSNMQYVDGRAAIEFSYRSGPPLSSVEDIPNNQNAQLGLLAQTWLLLNPDNGEAEGFFHMPSDFTGSALCYTGSHRFVYLSVVNGQPTLIESLSR